MSARSCHSSVRFAAQDPIARRSAVWLDIPEQWYAVMSSRFKDLSIAMPSSGATRVPSQVSMSPRTGVPELGRCRCSGRVQARRRVLVLRVSVGAFGNRRHRRGDWTTAFDQDLPPDTDSGTGDGDALAL